MNQSNLSLEKLEWMAHYIKSMPPVVVAFWFIDRPVEYYDFMCSITDWPCIPRSGASIQGAVRCYNIKSSELDDSCPFKEPGIWAEMNKGPHIKFEKRMEQKPSTNDQEEGNDE